MLHIISIYPSGAIKKEADGDLISYFLKRG
jgi:hypothetical protein